MNACDHTWESLKRYGAMTTTKHTPGPWWIPDGNIREHLSVLAGDKRDPYIVADCSPDDPMVIDDDEEALANARLIALAPAMVEVIRKIVEIADGKALHRGVEDEARSLLARLDGPRG